MHVPRSLPSILGLALVACSSAPNPSTMSTSKAEIASAPAAPEEARPKPAPAPIDESALVESERSRDPFRVYAVPPAPPPDDVRPRKSKRWSIEQLKLVGLVTSTREPRAMLLDPSGKGWIVSTGDIVGRVETVPAGVGDRRVSWRVDRIRESEVVLVRDDSPAAGDAATTRVLALRHAPLLSADD